MKLLFEDGNQHVGLRSTLDLGLYGRHVCAQKVLDGQALIDPFEEERDLPMVFVESCDIGGGQASVVGQRD